MKKVKIEYNITDNKMCGICEYNAEKTVNNFPLCDRCLRVVSLLRAVGLIE